MSCRNNLFFIMVNCICVKSDVFDIKFYIVDVFFIEGIFFGSLLEFSYYIIFDFIQILYFFGCVNYYVWISFFGFKVLNFMCFCDILIKGII